MYTVHVHSRFWCSDFVWISKVYIIIFRYLLPIVPVRLRWWNFTEQQNFEIFIDLNIHIISFNSCKIQPGQLLKNDKTVYENNIT